MAFFRKVLKKEFLKKEAAKKEYVYRKIFTDFSKDLQKAGESNVSLSWDYQNNCIQYTINGDKCSISKTYDQEANYQMYLRLIKEVEKFKSCRVEKRLFL